MLSFDNGIGMMHHSVSDALIWMSFIGGPNSTSWTVKSMVASPQPFEIITSRIPVFGSVRSMSGGSGVTTIDVYEPINTIYSGSAAGAGQAHAMDERKASKANDNCLILN